MRLPLKGTFVTGSSPLLFVLHVAGAAALLIWAVRLVRTGVERGWSVALRGWLRRGAQRRLMAAVAGLAAALLLQSSTAVTILVTNFVAAGTLPEAAGLAVVLGADLGSAFATWVLLARLDWMIPFLLVLGVVLFQKSELREWRMAGRVLIGLALIFVALTMIRDATEPLRDSPAVGVAMTYLGRDPLTAFVIGALLAWAVQSSVAAVLLFTTVAASGMLPASAAIAMTLGANLGGSFIAYVLTLGMQVSSRRVVLSNLVIRGGGAVLALSVLTASRLPMDFLGKEPAHQVIHLHILFNFAILVLALPLSRIILSIAGKIITPAAEISALERISALDPAALDTPSRALACAAREILQMGEAVEAMLRSVMALYSAWDSTMADAIRRKEEDVDKIHLETKLYLAKLQRRDGSDQIARKALDLAEMAVNLENAGNAISQTMLSLARRLDEEGLQFSPLGRQEVADFHDRVLTNAQAALNVLMTQNPDAARALVEEKDHVRDIEQSLQRSHLERLREGLVESIETSNIHQETLRALKQINTAFTQVGYPILSETGDLLSSRLTRIDRR